jgi:NTP pyrophosphatase (non-canonical NTP hydrolase)
MGYLTHTDDLGACARELTIACHRAALYAGWWAPQNGIPQQDNPLTFSSKLCLIHSEISEAMEGDRKALMDDHLPHRPMREVELADALIRVFDLAGAYGLDVAGALVEKMAYNATRHDHKPEVRAAVGGKTY